MVSGPVRSEITRVQPNIHLITRGEISRAGFKSSDKTTFGWRGAERVPACHWHYKTLFQRRPRRPQDRVFSVIVRRHLTIVMERRCVAVFRQSFGLSFALFLFSSTGISLWKWQTQCLRLVPWPLLQLHFWPPPVVYLHFVRTSQLCVVSHPDPVCFLVVAVGVGMICFETPQKWKQVNLAFLFEEIRFNAHVNSISVTCSFFLPVTCHLFILILVLLLVVLLRPFLGQLWLFCLSLDRHLYSTCDDGRTKGL